MRHGERRGESPAVRNAEHSEVRHGERRGESPAVRNAEHSEVQHGERTRRKPCSEECGAFRGAARREDEAKALQ